MQPAPHYSVAEVIALWQCRTRKPVWRAIKRGDVRAIKLGRRYLVNRDDVDAIARGETPAQVSP